MGFSLSFSDQGQQEDLSLLLPFALGKIEIYHRCETVVWAVIKYSAGCNEKSRVRKLDIDICDENGKVLIRMKEFSLRNLGTKSRAMNTSDNELFLKKYTYSDSLKSISDMKDISQITLPVTLSADKVSNLLKKIISGVIKVPVAKLESAAPLERYGIDSPMAIELTAELEKIFGVLSKTLFFEYQSIDELAKYFLAFHSDRLKNILGIKEIPETHVSSCGNECTAEVFQAMESTAHFSGRISQEERPDGNDKRPDDNDIAVIGISGRYPGAKNLQQFWENLSNGVDAVSEIPLERWDKDLYFDEDKNKSGKTYSKWGGFIKDIDQFDAQFFNISPKEAETLDPQERIFLQCVYETLEDAGYTRETLLDDQRSEMRGNVGVFVGVMFEEYQLFAGRDSMSGLPKALPSISASIANRVSYFCNFHGPSMAINTMCSSSLTSIHLACQSLLLGECKAAIAGGVNLSIHPHKYLLLSQGKFVSSKGKCESFGEGGDGYVPGEGVGSILLKPLSKAIEDGDNIYGIVKATAVNHGGKTNGYSVPNPAAQANVISNALKKAGVHPRTVSYIEAHGTGTSLGDPIEISGLNKAFREFTSENQYCSIGSVKSNIGHCEGAAGLAAVTKVLLQLKYAQLAPSLHSKTLNSKIDFKQSPFYVQQNLSEWKRPVLEISGEAREYPRIAGISSFGAGGSNAHLIIEEYIAKKPNHSSLSKNT